MVLFLKNLVFTLVVPGSVAVYLPLLIVRQRTPAGGVRLGAALAFLAAGAAIYGWCVWDFATFGRGTPAPIDAPRRLVVRGLYRFTRNPMYLGVLTVVLGWAVLFGAPGLWVYAVAVASMFHAFVTLIEEPKLRGRFAGEYEDYCARVPRWLPRAQGRGRRT